MPAKVVISFDFELGWGVLEDGGWKELERRGVYRKMREDIPRVISLLKKHQIQTTWAVVGGMLDPIAISESLSHLPNEYRDRVDAFVNEAEEETKNGLDLVEQLVAMGDLCEIGSHTSTHIYANHRSATEEQYISDIAQSISTLKKSTGKNINTVIFPRDQAKYRLAIAKQFPFLNMRLNPKMGAKTNRALRGLHFCADFVSPVPKSRIYVGPHDAIYHIGSMYFNMCGNKFRKLRASLLKKRANRLVNQIKNCQDNSVFHVWLHPFNLSESCKNLSLFCAFLEMLGSLQREGLLNTTTMANLRAGC